MEVGKVKWFNSEKGYGFISRHSGEDVFIHKSALPKGITSLDQGQQVYFDVVKGTKGWEAKNLHITGSDSDTLVQSNTIQTKSVSSVQGQSPNLKEVFPYDFHPRKNKRINGEKLKQEPRQYHDSLNDGCYDIAFEIKWTTLTPTAVNPCIDSNSSVKASPQGYQEGEYAGYNKRWLMIDNKLAISPFTVKSAIANGFANIMGGCYRVNTKKEGHKDIGKGQYLYGGRYKRYRVARDGSSKPGIVTDIKIDEKNGDWIIRVIPVKEFYSNKDLPLSMSSLKQGDEVSALVIKDEENKEREKKHKPLIIEIVDPNKTSQGDWIKVKYHGEYSCKKDSSKHNSHKYRFYQECGSEILGRIRAINFKDKDYLKDNVCIGGADPNGNPTEWYQDLKDIVKGSFVYYEAFNGTITNIGKNFLFKALFLHEDTVPEENSECKDITKGLCPRCSMFGMTDKTENEDKAANGFKGRFKASALVSTIGFNNEKEDKKKYPFLNQNIILKKWLDENNKQIAYQTLLPISLSPKPNKRDINGYFDKSTGFIKGAKFYKHGSLASADNINGVDNLPSGGEYSHSLRNFAQVCEKGLKFTGTVGAENCTTDEIAALLILLHTPLSNHGFKIGVGKAFGMGSIKSEITKVWIRGKDYSWKSYNSLKDFLDAHKEIESNTNKFKTVLQTIDNLLIKEGDDFKTPDIKLAYPSPGSGYWTNFSPRKRKH